LENVLVVLDMGEKRLDYGTY